MAISLTRWVHEADAAFRVGQEFKGDDHDSFLLRGKPLASSAPEISVAFQVSR